MDKQRMETKLDIEEAAQSFSSKVDHNIQRKNSESSSTAPHGHQPHSIPVPVFEDEPTLVRKNSFSTMGLVSGFNSQRSNHQHQVKMIGADVGEDTSRSIMVISLVIIALAAFGGILIYLESVLVPFFLAILVYYLLIPIVDLLTQEPKAHCKCTEYRNKVSEWTIYAADKLYIEVEQPYSTGFKFFRSTIYFFALGKFPRWLAVLVAVLFALFGIGLVFYIAVTAVASIAKDLDKYINRFIEILGSIVEYVRSFGVNVTVEDILKKIESIDFNSLALSALNALSSTLATIVVMLIFVMYLLMERQTDPRKGGEISDLNLKALGMKKEINVQIRKYITVKSFVSLLKGVIIGVVLSAASVPLAPVFGLLTFVLNFIPNIGPAIATVLPVVIVILDPDLTFAQRVAALIIPQLTQFTIGNFLEPILFGDQLNLHPAIVLLSLTLWGSIWGITGMIMSVPITSVIKIAIQDIDHYIPRTIARMLEGKLYNRMKTKKPDPKSKERKNTKRSGIWSRKSFMLNRKSKSLGIVGDDHPIENAESRSTNATNVELQHLAEDRQSLHTRIESSQLDSKEQ